MSGHWLALLLVLLVYLIGPNPKVAGAQAGDLLLVMYAVAYLAMARPRFHGGLLTLLAWPALVVLFTLLGKELTGADFGPEEINNLLKVASLSVLAVLGASVGLTEADDRDLVTARRLTQLTVLGIAFTGALGLLEYARPGAFRDLVSGLYQMELRTHVSSVEHAQLHGRIASIFSWANAFGEFLVFTMTVLLVNRRAVPWLVLPPALALGLVCLLLTNSRTSMLLFVFMLCYLAVMRGRWGTLITAFVVSVAVVAFVPLEMLIGAQNAQRLAELGSFVQHGEIPWNVRTRLLTLSYLPGRVLESPYAYFGFPIALYQNTVFLSWDNQYLGFLVKYGLSGALLVLWQWTMIVVPLVMLWRRSIVGDQMREALHTLVVLNLMIAIGGLAADTLFLERWQEFFFAFQGVVLGAAVAWRQPSPQEVEARETAAEGAGPRSTMP